MKYTPENPSAALVCCPERRGFALVVALSMMVCIVGLLLSLSMLTQVEVQSASQNHKLMSARQNALYAMQVAIGQLQAYAGPDQRVTATADIGDGSNLLGIAAPADGRRYWLGVWGNANAPGSNTVSPVLLNWLVSGNERARFSAANGGPPYSSVSNILFTATDPVQGLEVGSGIMTKLGTLSEPFQLLVGKGSVGADVGRYVAAPLCEISNASEGLVTGRYAWWIGDEGVKARVNLLDPHALQANAENRIFSFVTAQRSAVEWVDLADGGSVLNNDYPAFSSRLENILTLGDLGFLSPDKAAFEATVKARFHDLTSCSYSVLADVSRGGLKKDLTRALAPSAPSAAESARGAGYAPFGDREWIFAPDTGSTHSYGVPTWGMLRAYAAQQILPGSVLAPAAPVRGVSGDDFYYDSLGVSPVITYAGIAMDFTSPGGVGAHSPVFPAPIYLNIFPAVVLWNPYTVALGGGEYTIAIGMRSGGSQLQLREETVSGPIRAALELQSISFSADGGNDYFRFKLECPPIPAGGSIMFMLDASTVYQPGLTVLKPGLNTWSSAAIDTGSVLENAVDATKKFTAYVTNDWGTGAFLGGEVDAVLTAYDETGAEPSGFDPETNSIAWYAAAQRAGAGGPPYLRPARRLNADSTTSDMVFSFLTRFNFPDSGSSLALQWIAHANARAPVATRTRLDDWINSITGGNAGKNISYQARFGYTAQWPIFNTSVPRASAGLGLDVGAGGPTDVTLWEFSSPRVGLLSIGQLQHAPVSIFGTYPSYPIGNSLADFHLPRTSLSSTESPNPGKSNQDGTRRITTYYDISWLLNRALWDRYFFSGVPTGEPPSATILPAWTQADVDAGTALPNSRLHYYATGGGALPEIDQLVANSGSADSDPYNQAAANLLLAGGFNVNSTSEQAWRAVIASVNQLAYDPVNQGEGTPLGAALSRFSVPTDDASLVNPWEGYRQLNEVEIAELARNIVGEVRRRGPFLSLSEFVNRRLANDATGLKGTIQAAIDTSTDGSAANLASRSPFDQDRVDDAIGTGDFYDLEAMRNDISPTIDAAHRARAAFAPKFLTQADVLSVIGASLTARSDTFIVRAYGEVVDPSRDPANEKYVTARAWCEAVVQRVPDYMDQEDLALGSGGLRNALAPTATNAINQTFGRRFRVVSFRWLNPSEI